MGSEAAWRRLADEPRSVIHGDPNAANIRLTLGGVGLLDWDEARVDVSLLDLADLPITLSEFAAEGRAEAAKQAAGAWEAANAWLIEPAYARRRLTRLAQCLTDGSSS